MSDNLHGRSFLKELDLTPREWRGLLSLAASLKAAKAAGSERRHLSGKNIALIFEKTSTRTRSAFEVAAFDQGAHVTYLDPTGSQLGHKESIADTARVLERRYNAIDEIRVLIHRARRTSMVKLPSWLPRARAEEGAPMSSGQAVQPQPMTVSSTAGDR
jgi:ornithine carbamoyltransferase